ncbi:SWIM zinc finger family protein [Arenicella xantha]|uniref:Putative Zn finger protein n=1 Tax=Arenicella xantha TaxID=644221 RepID=A0A395JQI5_9GAMM|nr:SWIM zinc finger family protein [Arenicella xantha]RBP53807.1 putative Zn finger protein [Arenicella xantha]
MKVLSEDTFKTLAGADAYQRGLDYYNEGRVGTITIDGSRISAEVAGSRAYQVALHHTARIFEGSCNCPASDGFEFCKHCVAVALSYYYQTQTNQELGEASTEHRVFSYLSTLTKPQLVKELHDLLLSNSDAMQKWELKASIASGSFSTADIRKQITKALPYKSAGLWRHREIANYFEQAEAILLTISEPLLLLAPEAIEKLLMYALTRLDKTLKTIDDSGGYRASVEALLRAWFKAMIESEQWSENAKEESITTIILSADHAFESLDLPDSVANSLPTDSFARIHTKIEAAWNALTPSNQRYSDAYSYYRKLEQILLNRARAEHNVDKELEILGRGAVSVDRSLELVHRAINAGRISEARDWLHVAGHFDEPSSRELYEIESAQIELWLAEQNYQQALDAQWARFEEQEDAEILQGAITTATHLDAESSVLDNGIAYLRRRIRDHDTSHRNRQRAETLVHIYLLNQRSDDAIKLARRMPFSNATLLAIISATNQRGQPAMQLIFQLAQRLIEGDKNRQYIKGVEFLAAQQKRLDDAHQAAFQRSLQQLLKRPQNIRQPNLAKVLRANFAFLQES